MLAESGLDYREVNFCAWNVAEKEEVGKFGWYCVGLIDVDDDDMFQRRNDR